MDAEDLSRSRLRFVRTVAPKRLAMVSKRSEALMGLESTSSTSWLLWSSSLASLVAAVTRMSFGVTGSFNSFRMRVAAEMPSRPGMR